MNLVPGPEVPVSPEVVLNEPGSRCRPGSVISAVEHVGAMRARRSAEELRTLAHVKRLLELFTGDAEFREALRASHSDAAAQALVAARGLDVDLRDLGPVYRAGTPPQRVAGKTDYPLAKLWKEWIADLFAFRRMIRGDGYSNVADPRFNAWRQRQEARTALELGSSRADAITHPIASFELSKGCSVRCWFCGLAATPLEGWFARTEANRRLWRDTLATLVELFGPALQTSFCYWATEPADNPDYLDLLEDYREIVGVLPQTTSALPVRDLAWTRRLLAMYAQPPVIPSRFSIVSVQVLRELHATFTPEELLGYELIMQQKESSFAKARVGRTLHKRGAKPGRHAGLQVGADASSIACVSGFLVSMMDRTVQLVSPGRATERWPLGFRVHATGGFDDAGDLGRFVRQAIAEHMPATLPVDQVVAFREDLQYVPCDDGFAVRSGYAEHSSRGSDHVRPLGDLIAEGNHLPGDIVGSLAAAGCDVLAVRGTLQELFDRGVLEDLPAAVPPTGSSCARTVASDSSEPATN